ncbi:hypothetical protein TWF718_005732 [Orbilia javanica]|uniref:Actin-like ATPase domain-containing protein n=1 Tax=Orbilia javanica TaxID=47235 RepID=A0AAN8MVD9_9PEZI
MGREKLMVAVDFGTTFSGIAFCHSNQKELTDIEVHTSWSGNNIAPKLPTEIRYVPGRDPLWGHEAGLASERRQVANSAIIYNRFKLLLDVRGGTGLYGSSGSSWWSRNVTANDQIKLPRGKSAMDVSADYLRLLYNELMEKILRKRLPETLDLTPIHFVFTVPAIWGHQAQEATKWAAKKAGFCDRESDTLSLVSEPEAAAMYVLKAMHEANFSRTPTEAMPTLRRGDTFVVCDAGGGTVDLISYEVEEVSPSFKLREVVIGSGAKCGSSYIDQAFIQLLRRKIGPSFDNDKIWNKKDISRGSPLMIHFDNIKRSFGRATNDLWFIPLPVDVEDDEENGIVDNELEFTAQDLQQLFDPVVNEIVELVKGQVSGILSFRKTVSAIFLVGGFGESHYLYQSIERWAKTEQQPITVINPKESWSAIMRGAIVRELHPAVRSRRLRRHYGFACNQPFDPKIHDVTRSYLSVFGGRYVNGTAQWTAKMGDDCIEEKELVFTLFLELSGPDCLTRPSYISLYGCETPVPPMYTFSPGVYGMGTVQCDFSSASLDELYSAYDNLNGTLIKKYQIWFELRMKLESADVKFSIWRNGRCVGKADVSYD